jgi:hypothetical protein
MFIQVKRTLFLVLGMTASLGTLHCDAATVTAAMGSTIADGTGASKVISDLKDAANQLLDEAQNTGNVQTAQIGNQLNVLSANLQADLGDDVGETFGDLSDQEQQMLQKAEDWRWKLIQTKSDVYKFEATTNLDIDARLASLPFVRDKFFVRRVSNVAILPDKQSYDMEVTASQIGTQEGRTSQITLIDVNGKRLDDGAPRWTTAHTVTLHIPGANVAPLADDHKLVLVPATLRIDTEEMKGISGFFGNATHNTYDVPLKLAIYPRQAGKVIVSGKIPSFSWVQLPAPQFPGAWTTDGHCDNKCNGDPIRTLRQNHLEFITQHDEEIRNAKLTCDADPSDPSQPCTFAGVSYHDQDFQKGVKISGDGHTVTADWVSWTHPTHFTLSFELWQWQEGHPAPFNAVTEPIYWNKVTTFSIPTNRTEATVTVQPYAGQSYDLTVLGTDPNHLVSMAVQSLAVEGMDTYAISVVQPQYTGD